MSNYHTIDNLYWFVGASEPFPTLVGEREKKMCGPHYDKPENVPVFLHMESLILDLLLYSLKLLNLCQRLALSERRKHKYTIYIY